MKFEIEVEGTSYDDVMRHLCNALFDHKLIPPRLYGRIENSARLFLVNTPPDRSVRVRVSCDYDDRTSVGTVKLDYSFTETPEKAP